MRTLQCSNEWVAVLMQKAMSNGALMLCVCLHALCIFFSLELLKNEGALAMVLISVSSLIKQIENYKLQKQNQSPSPPNNNRYYPILSPWRMEHVRRLCRNISKSTMEKKTDEK
jgi:hypothetical protein